MTTMEAPVHPTQTDTAIAKHMFEHHATMVAELDRLTAVLRGAAPEGQLAAHTDLAEWFESVLVPHADEEESMTYRAAAGLPEGRLLIQAMVREHELIKHLVALFIESEFTVAAAYAHAIFEVFKSHQAKENEVIIPLLLKAADISLAEVVGAGHRHQPGDHGHRH